MSGKTQFHHHHDHRVGGCLKGKKERWLSVCVCESYTERWVLTGGNCIVFCHSRGVFMMAVEVLFYLFAVLAYEYSSITSYTV